MSQYDDPFADASRGLRGAEKNYSDFSSFKLELLALKWAVSDKFKEYLLGRQTVIQLRIILQTAKLGAAEQRWAAHLAAFDIEVKYRSDRTNKIVHNA